MALNRSRKILSAILGGPQTPRGKSLWCIWRLASPLGPAFCGLPRMLLAACLPDVSPFIPPPTTTQSAHPSLLCRPSTRLRVAERTDGSIPARGPYPDPSTRARGPVLRVRRSRLCNRAPTTSTFFSFNSLRIDAVAHPASPCALRVGLPFDGSVRLGARESCTRPALSVRNTATRFSIRLRREARVVLGDRRVERGQEL
jgi:hypothetical protein